MLAVKPIQKFHAIDCILGKHSGQKFRRSFQGKMNGSKSANAS